MDGQIEQIRQIHAHEHQDIDARHIINLIQSGIYYTHLFVILIYSTILLTIFPRLYRTFTGSLAVVTIYGFMLIWILLTVLICQLIKKVKAAYVCVRFVAKFIIILFPIFCAFVSIRDKFLLERPIETFMIYHLIISIQFLLYQLYSCTYGHHNYPPDLHPQNDLQPIKDEVLQRRKQYFDHKIKKMQSAPPA